MEAHTRHISCLIARQPNDDHFPNHEDMNMADDLGTDGLENQVKGAAKEVAGKVQKNVGDMTDNTSQELKGKAREVEGKTQRKVGEGEANLDRNT